MNLDDSSDGYAKISELAPIILFAFIRVDTLNKVIEALQDNKLAKYSSLYIFIDGPRNESDKAYIKIVYEYCSNITGFKEVLIHQNYENLGVDASEIKHINEIFKEHQKAIIIEDDIITAPNFLSYMNQALDFYKDNEKVMSIAGNGLKINRPQDYHYDTYSYNRSSSWGWGTWKDRWNSVDWDVKDWYSFSKNGKAIKKFNSGGSDMFKMLKNAVNGEGMWDIKFAYSQFRQNKVTIYPFLSKTKNVGFGDNESTHCKDKSSRYKIIQDEILKDSFLFNNDASINKQIHRQVYRYYSIPIRIYYKIRRILKC